MSLDPAVMTAALAVFCDPGAPGYQAPTDELDARKKWALAFFAYVSGIAPQPPPSTIPVAPTFFATLELAPVLGAIPGISDLAAAWSAAMTAMLVPVGDIFDHLDTRTAQLRQDLDDLFASPSLLASQRCSDIAAVFHKATYLITSEAGAVTYT